MYTEGIRKIFTFKNGGDLDTARFAAEAAGYSALSFNGQIHVKTGKYPGWIATCFDIDDFKST